MATALAGQASIARAMSGSQAEESAVPIRLQYTTLIMLVFLGAGQASMEIVLMALDKVQA